MSLVKSVLVWLFKLLKLLGLIRGGRYEVENAADVPRGDELRTDRLVLVGSPESPKWATFICPCGCGTALLLSLSPTRRPRWQVSQSWSGRPTVTPSIRRTDGCLSHFWIRNGQIDWCADSGK